MDGALSEKQSKVPKSGRGGYRPGSGRPKGSLDKGNRLIRDMIASALDRVGGVDYLARIAESHPQAFASLVGKMMPLQVTGSDGRTLAQELAGLNAVRDAGTD